MIVSTEMEHVRQWSPEKGVWHHAIIDHADRLGLLGYKRPVIVELMPEGLRGRPFDPDEPWERTPINDVSGASQRLRELFELERRHVYDLLSNNCEHVARFIASGEFKSEQIRALVAIGCGVALIWALRKAA